MALTPVFVDAETYWDSDYSLSKLSPIEYCYGDKFELQSMATRVGLDGDTVVTFGYENTREHFKTIDWANAWVIGHNCLTPDHEVLTPTGWVRFDQLVGGERIAQWDPNTGAATFVHYSPVVKPYSGTMLKYDSSFHKGVYTPEHRMFWRHDKKGDWRVDEVQVVAQMSPNRPYIPSAATYLIGHETTSLSVGEARLLEAFRADGTWSTSGAMQFGFKKLRKVSRMTIMLDTLGLRYSYKVREGVHVFLVFKNQEALGKIRALLGQKKVFGPSILTIPPAAQRAIVEETKYWDGSDWGGKTSHELSTCDKDSAEWLQILAILNGHGFRFTEKPMTGNWAKPGATVCTGMVRAKAQVKTLYAPEEIHYEGNVYCVTVPSSAFFVRRKGCVWVTGNCSEFDALLLAGNGRDHFGLRPKLWGCTLAMARPIHAKVAGGSLKALAEYYNLQSKGSLEGTGTKGLRLCEFTLAMRADMMVYNKDDVDILVDLFKILVKQTPRDEIALIDRTIRMLVEPRFECDTDLLRRGLRAERKRKERLLEDLSDKLGVPHDSEAVRAICASAPKFKLLLEQAGVDVPMKPGKKGLIPALAKTDAAMAEFLEHENPTVQAAAMARLGVRSTLLENRIERYIKAADAFNGRKPIALRYYGADTTGRFSGTMAMNDQNLPRIGKTPKISDVLRKSLRAPKGFKVVVADLSGIELRVNHFLWQEPQSMALYQDDPRADLYKTFAARLFDKPEPEITKDERQLAKVAQLGLGYGVGAPKFKDVARLMGGINLTDAESDNVTRTWRGTYSRIVAGWKQCGKALHAIHDGVEMAIDPWGLCVTCKEGIKTPKGMIRYPNLHQEGTEWWYGAGRHRAKIYGSKCVENLVQSLSRYVLTDALLAFDRTMLGRFNRLVHQVHDELIYIAMDGDAQEVLDTVQDTLRTPPVWWPELITWSEGAFAQDYGSVDK